MEHLACVVPGVLWLGGGGGGGLTEDPAQAEKYTHEAEAILETCWRVRNLGFRGLGFRF
jgi:hypothetical protein